MMAVMTKRSNPLHHAKAMYLIVSMILDAYEVIIRVSGL